MTHAMETGAGAMGNAIHKSFSATRGLRLSAALVITTVSLSIGVTLPAFADPLGPQNSTVIPVCLDVSGTVRDAFGTPTLGTSVTDANTGCGSHSAVNDANGHFTLNMAIGTYAGCLQPCGALSASHPGFVSTTKTVVPDTTAQPGQNDVTLLYDVSAGLSRTAIQPSQMITVTASSLTPASTSQMIIQLPTGVRQNMARGAT